MLAVTPDLILVLWSVVAFAFFVLEYWRMSGNFLAFAIGALGALAAWVLGQDMLIQVAVFAVLSIVSFLLIRPLYQRKLFNSSKSHAEGLELLVGREGTVISKIAGAESPGRVDIDGRPAKAIPVDPQQRYNVGDRVVVKDLDGDTLVVKKAKR